ncbi:MAG: Flp pilus assembly protein CpaB [Alphaproteobacteria bacterium]|nr:Flp pilus assembly protein CpaB [Alphaproteobacteria bacterium]MDE2112794.1 Flp pilus assembly protein CpaB [Alphaproteobacteria bacterium]MDE2493307.1 Flp pilus assembly protein CpaB [Alphaproteobacteria bacterium]
MNTRRLVILLLAAVAAGGAALLVRGLLGGGTPKAEARLEPPPVAVASVLVAAEDLQPGQPLLASQVRWQQWPASGTDASFIMQSSGVSLQSVVTGTVVRAPIVKGEPITFANVVKSGAAGFMAATLQPGMRAASISVSMASVAGGFILPNDRVDVILTQPANGGAKMAHSTIVLSDVRVLAIDQTTDSRNKKSVSDVRTATLELTPQQAEGLARAQASGTLSLALRPLSDSASRAAGQVSDARSDSDVGPVSIIRYGIAHNSGGGGN